MTTTKKGKRRASKRTAASRAQSGRKNAARRTTHAPKRAGRSTGRAGSGTATGREVELEAAVLRRLLKHFDDHKEVQNIELMILAGFCRNCLSKWLVEAAQERGIDFDIERARHKVYGMSYDEWKQRHQQPATEEQLARFAAAERLAAERRAAQKG